MVRTVIDGDRVPMQNIAEQLNYVWKNSDNKNSHEVGVLTTFHRDKAAEAMRILLQSELLLIDGVIKF